MDMHGDSVRIADPSDMAWIASLLGRAFENDPLWRYLIPATRRRPAAIERFHRGQLPMQIASGMVSAVGSTGVGIWQAPTQSNPGPPGWREAAAAARVFRHRLLRAARTDAATARRRAAVPPHLYLDVVAVDPRAAGQGIGRRLVEHGLAAWAPPGTGAYLEATSQESARLYERLGFRHTEALPLSADLSIYPMWRDGRPGSA